MARSVEESFVSSQMAHRRHFKQDVESQEGIKNDTEDESKKKNHPNDGGSANKGVLIGLIVAWYASSVVCTNTSKSLKLPWTTLTFFQMTISSFCAWVGIVVFQLDGAGKPMLLPSNPRALPLIVLLSLVFSTGFITLNASLSVGMHVSAVMTLRAAEPVATWLLGLVLLSNEKTSQRAVLCLIPIVLGAGLSALAKDSNVTSFGLMLVMACNVCFALRTIITKRLKARFRDTDNFNLFLQLCLMGSVWQGILWLLLSDTGIPNIQNVPVLLLNGLTFYLYLQLSWVVMGMISAITHSVCNALRRPVICAVGWIVFGGGSIHGIVGVLIATGGTMLYAQAKRAQASGK